MRVDENNFKILRRAEDILGTDYEIHITNDDECKGFIEDDNVIDMIDELCSLIDDLKEEMEEQQEDYEEQIRDCYTPKSSYDFYGVSEDMFH